MTAMKSVHSEKVQRAIFSLLMNHFFFATLYGRLEVMPDPSVSTACTNGKWIKYNPDFFESLTEGQIIFVFCHEILHVLNGHQLRRGTRDPRQYNAAGDYVINLICQDSRLELTYDCLIDPKYAGMTTEEVYDALSGSDDGDQGDQSEQGNGNDGDQGDDQGDNDNGDDQAGDQGGFGSIGDFIDASDDDGNPLDQAEVEAEATEWMIAAVQAAQIAKSKGNLPASLQKYVDNIGDSVVDWRTILKDFMDEVAKDDYAWARPNRRHIGSDVYLPSLYSESLRPLVIAIDTSGSVWDDELDQFAAEINELLNAVPCTVHVIYCDTRVYKTETFTADDLPIHFSELSRGGTWFHPSFEWVQEQRDNGEIEKPSALIYLTDMECDPYDQEVDYPVLWLSTTKAERLSEWYQPKIGEIGYLRG